MTAAQDDVSVQHVLFWGTYDLGKPRVRILIRGLQENGIAVSQCHFDLWKGVDDKSQVRGVIPKVWIALRLVAIYPILIWRYLRAPKHDVVIVGYLGLLDILVLWPFAKLRRTPVVLDAFLSIYNTVVEDRQLVGKTSLVARVLWFVEWLGCQAADRSITDTQAHADYFSKTYRQSRDKIGSVLVGAEPEVFDGSKSPEDTQITGKAPIRVLFYGQFIPLHGIETIVEAAALSADEIEWRIVGRGQEADRIKALIDRLRPHQLVWDDWVPYEELVQHIQQADICLGIFGTTEKAARVIPNKVFQILLAKKPLITADTPAIRELLAPSRGLMLVPPGNPQALYDAVIELAAQLKSDLAPRTEIPTLEPFHPGDIGRVLIREILLMLTGSHKVKQV